MTGLRRGGMLAAAGALMCLALTFGGCSRTAMEANPFATTRWMGETGVDISLPKSSRPDVARQEAGPESRINLWPIYYQRGPAWSAVWPLVASSPHGSAVIPFYEFLRVDHHLRLGVIHQWVPAIFDKNGARESWRFLNVERVKPTKTFNVYPLFWRNSDRTFLFPLYYGDDDGYWTPLWMNRGGTAGALGPLFFRSKENWQGWSETRWWYPFPLARHWSGSDGSSGNQLFPLWYYGREADDRSHFNLAGILADYQRLGPDHTKFKYLLPLGKIERNGADKKNWLMPFWYYNREGDHTQFISWVNGYYDRRGEDERQYVHPLWIDMKTADTRHIMALIFLYHFHQDGPRKSWSVLWPLINFFENDQSKGHIVAPLWLYEREKGGPAFFVSLLFGFKSDGSVISVLGPLFLRLKRPEGTQTAILWPLIRWWDTEREKGHTVFPLWYANTTPESEGKTFMTPLVGWSRNKYGTFRHFLGPVYMAQDEFEHDFHWRTVAFPFFHHIRNRDKKYNILFPLLLHSNTPDHKAAYTIPLSAGRVDDRKFVNVALFLAHWTASPRDARFYMLVRLAGYHRLENEDVRAWWAWPLIGWKRAEDTRKFGIALDAFGYQRNPESQLLKWWMGWFLVKYERRQLMEPGGSDGLDKSVMTRRFSWPLWRVQKWDREDQMDAFTAEFERLAKDGSVPDEFSRTIAAGQPYYLEGRPARTMDSLIKLYFRAKDIKVTAREGQLLEADGENWRMAAGADGQRVKFDFSDVKESWFFPYLSYVPGLKKFGPMFYYWKDPRLGFQRRWLFGLWTSQQERGLDGAVTFERQSLLSYLYSREKEGGRTSVDMFPFLSWDREEGTDMKRFSFAAGLFEKGRKGDEKTMKIFWIRVK